MMLAKNQYKACFLNAFVKLALSITYRAKKIIGYIHMIFFLKVNSKAF